MKTTLVSVLTAGLVIGSLGTAAAPVSAAPKSDAKIIVEDKPVTPTVDPFTVNDYTFVPLRDLSEALNATVSYDAATNVATIEKDGILLVLNFRTGDVQKNGQALKMDPAPRFVNDRTMVPLRFISQAFGNEVTFDNSTGLINVLASAATLKQRTDITDVLAATEKAMTAINSFHFAYDVKAQSKGTTPSTLNFRYDMAIDYTKQPFGVHQEGELDLHMGPFKENRQYDTYRLPDKLYSYNWRANKWFVSNTSGKNQWNDFMRFADIGTYQSDLSDILPYMTLKENAKSYDVTVKMNKDKFFATLGKDINALAPQTTMDEWMRNIDTMTITVSVDKKTYQQDTVKMDVDVSLLGAELRFSMNGSYSDYNQVDPITVPANVLKGL